MVQQRDDHQLTALLLAESRGQESMVNDFLEFGDVPQQLVGKASLLRALSAARSNGYYGVVSLLCRHDTVVAMINGSDASAVVNASRQ